MAGGWETLSVLIAVEFVVMAAAVLILVPLDAVVWVLPLFVVFLLSLYAYWS